MSDFESPHEKNQAIANLSAQFVHDITTPLTTIKILAGILETCLPATLSAYQQLKAQGAPVGAIAEDQYAALESSAATIKKLAQQVNQAARDYWQQIDAQTTGSQEPDATAASVPAVAHDITLENPLRILVAEDDVIHQKIAAKLLSGQHQVDIAANGRDAVEYCRNKSYDLVLMDLHMPIMDGTQAVAQIMQLKNSPTLIIGLTNRPLGSERKQLLQQGFNGFIEKPLRIDELTALMKNLRAGNPP